MSLWPISFIISIMIMYLMNWSNPSAMILNLIILATIICLFMSKTLISVWVGFSLFMVFVGGLMILFILIASMIPNDILKSTQLTMMVIPIMMIISMNLSENIMEIMDPKNMFEMKIPTMMFIIVLLNLILMLISKMIMSPIKPYRGTN